MDQIYYGIYQTLYAQGDPFPRLPVSDGFFVKEQIARAEEEELAPRKLALRPDAKYLLFLNFHAMVRAPLLLSGRVAFDRIREDTDQDLRRIMRTAAERAVPPAGVPAPAQEVSGHQIIDAVSTVWGELRTLVHNAWD